MAVIRSFRDLQAYRLAMSEARNIFFLTKKFPREEIYSLTNQMRRSSRAVCAMISEAWARRRYPAAFVSKMDEALGEANEPQCWLDHALGCEYMSQEDYATANDAWQHVGAMVRRMIDRKDDFCGTKEQ